ncbi:MAG: M13 family metallopeptidase [Janthinobacterium lividum]
MRTTPRRFIRVFFAASVLSLPLLTLSLSGHAQSPLPPTVTNKFVEGLDLSAMDTRVKPSDNFFRYANGAWLDRTTIPAEKSYSGVYDEVTERNLAILRSLAETAAADKTLSQDSPQGKVGSFYRSGMDTAHIEAEGIDALKPEMAAIDAIHDTASLEAEIGHLHRLGIGAGWTFYVNPDDKASDQQIGQLYQGGIGLPERGYYERRDRETVAIRRAYMIHIGRMLTLIGDSPKAAEQEARIIIGLETRLALASKTPVDQRDPEANYHKMTLPELNALTPGTDWQPYFSALGLPSPDALNVAQPGFFVTVGQLLNSVPINNWKVYLRWNLISTEAPRLSDAFVREDFHFNQTVLNGVPQNRPRWKRVLTATDESLGEALGQMYVAQAFSPQAKSDATALVQNLKAALHERLQALDWMSADTKAQALEKLDMMAVKVGYPDHWRDYSELDVSSASYAVNGMHADEFEFQRNLNKIGQPIDHGEWGMTPPTVNAYYSAEMNDINFPAGILQPPLFDSHFDDAVNYGVTGATIGHEMTHGFDDQGRQYDAHGNLHNWWTASDVKAFTDRAQGIIAQYNAYQPLPGLHVNGTLTQGENVADIGGLKIAYLAFEKTIAGKPHPLIEGFTPEQRFFIAYAQSFRGKVRPETQKTSLLSDPHSPDEFRVNGAVADMPEFHQAFNCPPVPGASPTTIW